MAPAGPPHALQVGDRVQVVASRHNPLHHEESYKVGERGVVLRASDHSSVVQVRLEGEYHVVESVLPLVKRAVPHRVVSASVLHLAGEAPAPQLAQRSLPGLPPPQQQLLPVEEGWLKAIFKQCDSGCDNRINRQELLQSCQRSADIAAFFGVSSGGSLEALEAVFKEVAGRDEQITWEELCGFYRRRLESVAGSGPPAEELSEAEDAMLRQVVQGLEVDPEGRVSKAALLEACGGLSGAELFFGLRPRLRREALEDVTRSVVDGIVRMIGGDDGEITFAEVCHFAVHSNPDGSEGLSMAEKHWLDTLFKRFEGAFGATETSMGTFAAREGECITKQQLITACREAPENALLFGLRRSMEQKSLEAATQDALATVLQSAGGRGAIRVSWEEIRAHFAAAQREPGGGAA